MPLCRKAIRIMGAGFGLVSNNEQLIHAPENFKDSRVESLLTAFHFIDEIPYSEADGQLDAHLYALDVPTDDPIVRAFEDEVWAIGDFASLESEVSDRRYTLFSNMGLFFRFALATLERHHGVFSLHASAMYRPDTNDLLIVVGSGGSGKSIFLLEGMNKGYEVFSAEMLYMRMGAGGWEFLKGALMDNVRLGTLQFDYPELAESLGIEIPVVKDPWKEKLTIDLRSKAAKQDVYDNANVTLLFPWIEAGRESPVVREITDERELTRMLFVNASEKIGSTTLLYETLPIGSFDRPSLLANRWKAIRDFAHGDGLNLVAARTVLASPQNCLDTI